MYRIRHTASLAEPGPRQITSPKTARILRIAVCCAVLLALATTVSQLVDYGVYDLRYKAFNSNTHRSIFGGVSLFVDAIAVAAAFVLAGRARVSERFILACALAVLLCLRIASPGDVLVVALPFTGIALVILWRQGTGVIQRTIRAGCLLLVLSFVIHAAETNALSPVNLSAHSWSYQARCVVKHDAELAGWILIAGGFLCLRSQRTQASDAPERPGRQSVTA